MSSTLDLEYSILVFDEADFDKLNIELQTILAGTSFIVQEIREFTKLLDAAQIIFDQNIMIEHMSKTQNHTMFRCLLLRACDFLQFFDKFKSAGHKDSTKIIKQIYQAQKDQKRFLEEHSMHNFAKKARNQAFAHIDYGGIKKSLEQWTEEKETAFIQNRDPWNSCDTFGETVVYVLGLRHKRDGSITSEEELRSLQTELPLWVLDVCRLAVETHQMLLGRTNEYLQGPSVAEYSTIELPRNRYAQLKEFRLPLFTSRKP